MNFDDMTMGEFKQLSNMMGGHKKSHAFKEGQCVFIRCVIYHYIGVIEEITDSHIVLSTASWVADSGRFYTALKDGKLNEVEPMPHGVTINRDAIIDFSPWRHDAPTSQK
jgi:hypothetical protein